MRSRTLTLITALLFFASFAASLPASFAAAADGKGAAPTKIAAKHEGKKAAHPKRAKAKPSKAHEVAAPVGK
jgi:hypothetical protein